MSAPKGARPFVLETRTGTGTRRKTMRSHYLHFNRAVLAAVKRQLEGARESDIIRKRSGRVKARVAQDGQGFIYIYQEGR